MQFPTTAAMLACKLPPAMSKHMQSVSLRALEWLDIALASLHAIAGVHAGNCRYAKFSMQCVVRGDHTSRLQLASFSVSHIDKKVLQFTPMPSLKLNAPRLVATLMF